MHPEEALHSPQDVSSPDPARYREQLQQEIAELEQRKQEMIASQTRELGIALERFIKESLKYLEQRRQELESAIAVLERRKERLEQEMRSTYAGASQEVAIKVQGFKDYLIGSLQDIVTAAEQQLGLIPTKIADSPAPPSDPPQSQYLPN